MYTFNFWWKISFEAALPVAIAKKNFCDTVVIAQEEEYLALRTGLKRFGGPSY